jgi:hypothetical protein
MIGLPEGAVEEIAGALTRWRASPSVVSNLEGLLTPDEIRGYSRLLVDIHDRELREGLEDVQGP